MKHRHFVLAFAAILLLCVFITSLLYGANGNQVAEISVNGEVLHQVDLNRVETPYEIPIEQDGKLNIVYVEDGQISVKSANCPDGLCVKQGAIHSSFYPIVCLPNNVVIQIKGGSAEYDTPDAISR